MPTPNYTVDTAPLIVRLATSAGGANASASTRVGPATEGANGFVVAAASASWTVSWTSRGYDDSNSTTALRIKCYYKNRTKGTTGQLLFGGSTTVDLAAVNAGSVVSCDPVTTDAVRVGDHIDFWSYISSPTGGAVTINITNGFPDNQAYSNSTTVAGSGADIAATMPDANLGGGLSFGPFVMQGAVAAPIAHVMFRGDSNTRGEIADPWFMPNFPTNLPYIRDGQSGTTAHGYLTNAYLRPMLAKPGAVIVINFGTNDLSGGRTAAQVWADLQTIAAQDKASGAFKVYITTIFPNSYNGNEANRLSLNALIRGNLARVNTDGTITGSNSVSNIDGYIDIADATETARDSGVWAAGLSSDGLHVSHAGAIAASGAVPQSIFVVGGVTAPTITQNGGTVTFNDTDNATSLYYSTNGVNPTNASTAIALGGSITGVPVGTDIRCIAYKGGAASTVTQFTTIALPGAVASLAIAPLDTTHVRLTRGTAVGATAYSLYDNGVLVTAAMGATYDVALSDLTAAHAYSVIGTNAGGAGQSAAAALGGTGSGGGGGGASIGGGGGLVGYGGI